MNSTSNIFNVDIRNFEKEVTQSEIPVFVEFRASWCGPCHIISPMIEELAVEYNGYLKFCRVDTDENIPLKEKFGVADLPTIILFKNGLVTEFIVGTKPKSELKISLEKLLNG